MQASSARSENAKVAVGRQHRRIAAAGAAVFVLVFLTALGSSRADARVGRPGKVLGPGTVAGDLDLVLILLGLVALAAFVLALGSGLHRRRRDEDEIVRERPAAPWWEKALFVGFALVPAAILVTVFVLGHRGSHDQRATAPPGVPSTSGPRPGHGASSAAPHAASPTVHWLLWAVVALFVVLLLVAVALRRHSRVVTSDGAEPANASLALQDVIQESLDDLELESDPRRAVIRAYGGMEHELARHGLGRQPFEAPLEYLTRSLSLLRVSAGASERLTALFQRARFSTHTIDAAMKRQAIRALAAVRDELGERPTR